MDELHRRILQSSRSYLIDNIDDIGAIVDLMFEKDILTEGMKQDIMQAEKTTVRQVRRFLDFLPKRGPFAFDTFCNVLIQLKHRSVAQHLNPTLDGLGATPVPPDRGGNQNSNHQQPAEYHPQPSGAGSNQQPSGSNPQPRPTRLPQPMSINIHEQKPSIGQPKSHDKPKATNQNPVYGRQSSSGIPVDQPEENFPVFPFPDNWPDSLNMAPFGSKDFWVDSCMHDDIKRIQRHNIYRMCSAHRGKALIINNQEFSGEGSNFAKRNMSDTDSNRLQLVLKKLAFQVQTTRDLKYKEMEEMLQRFKEYVHEDAFILIILSYGGDGTVFCADGKEMKIQDIVNTYSTDKCATLIGKPKLFFIQACGVQLEDVQTRQPQQTQIDHEEGIVKGLKRLSLGSEVGDEMDTIPGPQGGDDVDTNPGPDTGAILPVDTSDSLVAMATGPDINHKDYGSVFMLALSYVLCHCSKNQDLRTMLQRINQLQKDGNTGQFIKLCEVRSSLKSKLFFLPGYPLKGSERDKDFPPNNPLPLPSFGATKHI